jgi:hypothetical protein
MGNEALDAAADDESKKLEFIPRQYTADWKRCSHFFPLPCYIKFVVYV